MADAAAFRNAQSRWRELLDAADDQRRTLSYHEPFAGIDDVLCAGCLTSTVWTQCPEAHITLRLEQFKEIVTAPLRDRIAQLEAELEDVRSELAFVAARATEH